MPSKRKKPPQKQSSEAIDTSVFEGHEKVLVAELIKLFQKSVNREAPVPEKLTAPPRALTDVDSEAFPALTETSDTPDFSAGGAFPVNKHGEIFDSRGNPRDVDNLMAKVGTLEARVDVLTNVAKEDRNLLIQIYTTLKAEGRL